MPRQKGRTPGRNIRVPDEVWVAAKAAAEQAGTTVSAEVVAFLHSLAAGAPNPEREKAPPPAGSRPAGGGAFVG